MQEVLVVNGLGKRFRRYHSDRPLTLQDAVLRRFRRLRASDSFWALKNISFHVAPGRMVGIVGRNGAGKSTLLRLIGGVGKPDQGNILLKGRAGALIELGAGFHSDLTGQENVFINGIISGLTRREVSQRFDRIIRFAELEAFVDNPLRTYSTGMQMRLAFSIAVHTNPDILLVDEVLAVGDYAFQQKCLERIIEIKKQGCAILLVSHNTTLVAQLCDEALWLDAGRLMASGPANVVADQYVDFMKTSIHSDNRADLRMNINRFGSLEVEIVQVRFTNSEGYQVSALQTGDSLQVEVEFFSPGKIETPIFGVTISNEEGVVIADTSTFGSPLFPEIQGKGKVALYLDRLDMVAGTYYLDVGIYQKDWSHAYDYHWHAYPIKVEGIRGEKGILQPPHSWSCDTLTLSSKIVA